MTLTLVKHTQSTLTLNTFVQFFENLTRGSKEIEQTQKCDEWTDRLTDGQTDNEA